MSRDFESTPVAKILLAPPEAAHALSVSERFLWGMTAPRGPIPCVRLGKSVRYHVEAINKALESMQQPVVEG